MENRRRQAESYFRKKLKIGDRVQYTIDGYQSFLRQKENRFITMDEWAELYNSNPDAMDKAIAERKGTIVEDWKGTDSGWMETDDDKIWQFGWVVRWDDENTIDELEYFGYLRAAEEVEEAEEARVEELEETVSIQKTLISSLEKELQDRRASKRQKIKQTGPRCLSCHCMEKRDTFNQFRVPNLP